MVMFPETDIMALPENVTDPPPKAAGLPTTTASGPRIVPPE